MAAKARREFTPEFKREAVALLRGSGRPLALVAAELGIQPSMLRHWRAAQNGDPARPGAKQPTGSIAATGPAAPSPADLASENAKLRRELERTRMERDVLKNHRHLRGGAEVRFAFIEQHAAAYPVRLMCRVLKVSPSGYYSCRAPPVAVITLRSRRISWLSALRRRPPTVYGLPI
jgi:transposase